jgi:Bax protein
MDYTNNKEFIEDVIACTVHLNSMYSEHERVPVDLVVAQAIHESEWGRSRFAVEGNNLLGIRTFDPADDQIKPLINLMRVGGLGSLRLNANPYLTISNY